MGTKLPWELPSSPHERRCLQWLLNDSPEYAEGVLFCRSAVFWVSWTFFFSVHSGAPCSCSRSCDLHYCCRLFYCTTTVLRILSCPGVLLPFIVNQGAVIGSRVGRLHWPGSRRTLEGSASVFLTTLSSLALVSCLVARQGEGSEGWTKVAASLAWPAALATLMEAFTTQVLLCSRDFVFNSSGKSRSYPR